MQINEDEWEDWLDENKMDVLDLAIIALAGIMMWYLAFQGVRALIRVW